MFTGLVQAVGQLVESSRNSIWVSYGSAWPDDPLVLGESIAANGCCLTAADMRPTQVRFDLSGETLTRTTFGKAHIGSKLNLERALRVSDRLGGHIVQGHIDCVGTVVGRTAMEAGEIFEFQVPSEYEQLLVDKGSVCIDGISLTVIEPASGSFRSAIIPHTLEQTNLNSRTVDDLVNVEYDILAKTILRLSEPYK